MNESNPSDAALAELLTLTVKVGNDGTTIYCNHLDQVHRIHGPAYISCGNRFWFNRGQLHREDGPAIEYFDGAKQWYRRGKRHRTDGPAIEFSNGTKYWFLDDQRLSKVQFHERVSATRALGQLMEPDTLSELRLRIGS